MRPMTVFVRPGGTVEYVYRDGAPAAGVGKQTIERASRVEPAPRPGWYAWAWHADLGPSGGPVLGPYDTREQALRAEEEWLLARLRNGPRAAARA